MPADALLDSLGFAAGALPAAGAPYLVAGLILLACYAPGRALAGPLAGLSPVERGAVATGLGLVVVATLLFVLGLAGAFTAPAVAAVLAACQAPRLAAWIGERGRPGPPRPRRPSGAALATVAGAVLALLFVATLALYPPLGFDATLYHLPAAAALADGHRLAYLADSRTPVFPQLAEVLFAAGLPFGDDRAARLLELAAAALTAVVLFGWVRRRGSAAAGLWASALWIGSPYVVLFGADAYVDVTLALFATLSALALAPWREDGAGRWPWIAGAFAGAAAATKYLGLFFVVAVPVGFLVAGRGRRGLRPAAFALLAAAAAAGPWYARIAYHTGNPVFPFFPEVFGTSEWVPFVGVEPFAAGEAAGRGVGSVLRRLAVGTAGEWSTWAGPPAFDPFLWVLAPAVLLLVRRPRPPLLPIALGLSYAPAVWLLAPEPRYLLPALPWAAAAVALGLARLVAPVAPPRWWPRRIAVAATVVLLAAPGLGYAAYRISRQGPVPATAAEREAFLAARRPGYAAIRLLDRRLGGAYTLYNLGGEDLRYFARGRYLGDWSGPDRFAPVLAAARRGPDALAAELRALGAGYLLVVDPADPGTPPLLAGDPGGGFRRIYRDLGSRLYAVPEPAAVTATSREASPQPRPARPAVRTPGSGRSAGGGG